MARPRAWVSWSSGKDAAYALHVERERGHVEIVGLLTTTSEHFARVAMHGVRRDIVEAQARSVGLPLVDVPLPWPCPNEAYEARMRSACDAARAQGVSVFVFGDLFLEDIRRYREERLAQCGMHARELAGRLGDESLLAELGQLPQRVDPCFERGEAHTCVIAGPMFSEPIELARGETVERDGFVYTDWLLADAGARGSSR
jgi:diphthamide synthase (EF-2-diphthine--ammonia ligase)